MKKLQHKSRIGRITIYQIYVVASLLKSFIGSSESGQALFYTKKELHWKLRIRASPVLYKKRASLEALFLEQGYKDSNLEMLESESSALPFGDSPKYSFVVFCDHE